MISKKWILKYILLSFIFCSGAVLFNFYVDNYSIFRNNYSKLLQEPNQNFIKMNFLINNNHSFDSFIFGSSRVGKINPTGIKNGNYYNMTYSEGLPIEHLSNIKLLIKNNIKIKNILIGLDDFSYEVNPMLHKNEPMRQLHYDTDFNLRSQISFYMYYLFKRPSFFDIYRAIQENAFNRVFPVSNFDIYNTGLPLVPIEIESYIENNKQAHINNKKFLRPAYYRGNRIKETISHIKEIVELSKKYNFNLLVFINPIHKTTYLDTNFTNFQTFKQELVKITDYYDFSGLNKITTNNYYYYETSHYRVITGELIKKRLFSSDYEEDFGILITKDNIDWHINNLRSQINKYSLTNID